MAKSAAVLRNDELAPTPWQCAVLATPREADLALLGGKGSGKTALVPFLAMRDEAEFGPDARMLYVRRSHGGAQEFMLKLFADLARAYGIRNVTLNSQTGLFKFGRATLQVDQLAEPKDLQKHWGKNYSLIICDEVGEYNGLDLIEKLRASLRPPSGIPARMVLIGNPGSVNHAILLRRFVAGVTPWTPSVDVKTGRTFIYCPSTYRDNPHIDQSDYVAQLRAACNDDPELLKAWLDGSFAVAKGGFFASVIDEARNMVESWTKVPTHYGPPWPREYWGAPWTTFIAMDWGSSAPAVVYAVAESPGSKDENGRFIPRDSLVLFDEISTNRPDSLSEGLGWTVPKLAEVILEMCGRWDIDAQGCADDACFARMGSASGSIAEEFTREGVYFSPARKADRLTGWQTMRTLLADAGKPDRPGMYISRSCSYWWQTVPFLPRDPRRPDDCDSRSVDHSADVSRYLCNYNQNVVRQTWPGGRTSARA